MLFQSICCTSAWYFRVIFYIFAKENYRYLLFQKTRNKSLSPLCKLNDCSEEKHFLEKRGYVVSVIFRMSTFLGSLCSLQLLGVQFAKNGLMDHYDFILWPLHLCNEWDWDSFGYLFIFWSSAVMFERIKVHLKLVLTWLLYTGQSYFHWDGWLHKWLIIVFSNEVFWTNFVM